MKLVDLKGKTDISLDELNIKTYLPILRKAVVANNIVASCLMYDENTNIAYVDNVEKQISMVLFVLTNYCDLETDENDIVDDIIDVIDMLQEKGVYKNILDLIGDDYYVLYEMIETEIDSALEKHNCLGAVLARGLGKFVDVVEKNTSPKNIKSLVKAFSKEFQNFDMGKLTGIMDLQKSLDKVEKSDVPKTNESKKKKQEVNERR